MIRRLLPAAEPSDTDRDANYRSRSGLDHTCGQLLPAKIHNGHSYDYATQQPPRRATASVITVALGRPWQGQHSSNIYADDN